MAYKQKLGVNFVTIQELEACNYFAGAGGLLTRMRQTKGNITYDGLREWLNVTEVPMLVHMDFAINPSLVALPVSPRSNGPFTPGNPLTPMTEANSIYTGLHAASYLECPTLLDTTVDQADDNVFLADPKTPTVQPDSDRQRVGRTRHEHTSDDSCVRPSQDVRTMQTKTPIVADPVDEHTKLKYGVEQVINLRTAQPAGGRSTGYLSQGKDTFRPALPPVERVANVYQAGEGKLAQESLRPKVESMVHAGSQSPYYVQSRGRDDEPSERKLSRYNREVDEAYERLHRSESPVQNVSRVDRVAALPHDDHPFENDYRREVAQRGNGYQNNNHFNPCNPSPRGLHFDGTGNWVSFKQTLLLYVTSNSLTNSQGMQTLVFSLSGAAKDLYASLSVSDVNMTFDKLMWELELAFGDIRSLGAAENKFRVAVQGPDESLQMWAARVRQLGSTAYPGDDRQNSRMVEKFCMDLLDRSVGMSVYTTNRPASVNTALQYVQERFTLMEIYPGESRRPQPRVRFNQVDTFVGDEGANIIQDVRLIKSSPSATSNSRLNSRGRSPSPRRESDRGSNTQNATISIADLTAWLQSKSISNPGDNVTHGEQGNRQPLVPPAGYICYNCNVPGHFKYDCTARRGPATAYTPRADECHYCHVVGHFKRDCPKWLANNLNGTRIESQPNSRSAN